MFATCTNVRFKRIIHKVSYIDHNIIYSTWHVYPNLKIDLIVILREKKSTEASWNHRHPNIYNWRICMLQLQLII